MCNLSHQILVNQKQFGGGGHVDLADVLIGEPELVENFQNPPLSLLVVYWSNCWVKMENFCNNLF